MVTEQLLSNIELNWCDCCEVYTDQYVFVKSTIASNSARSNEENVINWTVLSSFQKNKDNQLDNCTVIVRELWNMFLSSSWWPYNEDEQVDIVQYLFIQIRIASKLVRSNERFNKLFSLCLSLKHKVTNSITVQLLIELYD